MRLIHLLQKLSIRLSGAFFLVLQAGLFQLMWTPQTQSIEIYLTYSILAVLAVLAAIGFFFLQQAGWLLAMMTQGVSLMITLFIYFFGNAILLAQITLAYSIFMVLYFNLHVIRSAFYTGENNGKIYE
jgi:hypothetical protein